MKLYGFFLLLLLLLLFLFLLLLLLRPVAVTQCLSNLQHWFPNLSHPPLLPLPSIPILFLIMGLAKKKKITTDCWRDEDINLMLTCLHSTYKSIGKFPSFITLI